jgi:uncharacterized RDD family membrane protein YckC
MSWYYADNNERRGPIEDAAFQSLVASGTIKPDTLVWREGFPEWIAYRQTGSASGGPALAPSTAPAVSPEAGGVITTAASPAGACSQCGRLFPMDDMVSYEGRYICADCKPLFFQKIREGASVVGQRDYAGFWSRVRAKILDTILLIVVNQVVLMIMGLIIHDRSLVAIIGSLFNLATNATYVIYMTGKYGATLGKMACKIEVIKADDSPMTMGVATGRYFAEILSGLTLGIGYIMVAFDEEKRALHDRICETRVVRKPR